MTSPTPSKEGAKRIDQPKCERQFYPVLFYDRYTIFYRISAFVGSSGKAGGKIGKRIFFA
jgi:hypothetical protein